MTSNSLARAVFTLFGALLVVHFFITAGASLSGMPLLYVEGEYEASGALAALSTSAAARILGAALFHLVPGIVFLLKGETWADRLVPPGEESGAYIEYTALLAIGLTLLGAYFLVIGLAGTLGGIVRIALADEYMRESAIEYEIYAFVQLVCGAVLVQLGRRVA